VRIIAATHRDLEALVERGELRQDLFYRIRVVEIALPSLAERGPDEIRALARHFLDLYTRRHDRGKLALSREAERALAAHAWPGNVRELEHAIERAVVLAPGDTIEATHLGLANVRGAARVDGGGDDGGDHVRIPLGLSLDEVQRRYVDATLRSVGGNRTHAAKALGVGRNTLKRKAAKTRASKA
jgi:Nif-specific regulatory protein